ncbi:MAG: DUF1553 domain-containing protein, partial [Planctomycetes bacterium]|nr:DUF1553 domain-containing protein [Planctomycetota bacterium]
TVGQIVKIPPAQRTAGQLQKLEACFLDTAAPQEIRQQHERRLALRQARVALIEEFPTTMVMQEMPVPRETFVLTRGEYNRPGEKVAPGVPACFHGLPPDTPNNRLGLARWIVDADQPLTARVAVNRLWQMVFGTGLVKTVDDFGSQGEWPSHPELLDWLAVQYQAGVDGQQKWDTKRLVRLLVTSATYRQSSRLTPQLQQRDPENRLLGRGPRTRLSAEMVRDQALFAGGMLVERLGGPSVKPYQPAGLWKELADTDYVQDTGENLYRRTMYTYFKRTVAPPTMMTFDAAGRETCVVRETRTNTPLQALTLMNEVTFVEAARGLAQRVLLVPGLKPADRLSLACEWMLSRPPRGRELEILLAAWQSHRERFHKTPAAAERLTKIGELPRPAGLDPVDLAACMTVVEMLFNLDEAITKE